MIFDYEYFFKPILILALFAYGTSAFYRFWDHALKRRNEIFGTSNTHRDGIVFPFPRKVDDDPRHRAYRDFVYPRFWHVAAKTATSWALAILIAFT